MTDVASLSFSIDSSDARRARGDLDALKMSASDMAEAQLRVTKAVREGRDPIRELRAELELFQRDTTNAQRGVEGLIDRLNQLTQALASGGGSMRELRQTVGQVEAAAVAFNTTATGMEMFIRTSRNIGISATETTNALARIEGALRGVTDEGNRARQVLRDYGVSTDGGRDSAAVLREFTERLRTFRSDGRMGSDIQAVLGPMTTAGIAALRDPEYRTIGQREREMRADAEAQRIGELRNGVVSSQRDRERRQSELADLEREFGYTDWGPRSPFQSDNARRRELEERRAQGMQSLSAYQRSDAYVTDPLQFGQRYGGSFGMAIGGAITSYRAAARGLTWLGSDEFALRARTIEEDALDEAEGAGFFGTFAVGGRAAYRHVRNIFGGGEVNPRRDTRPVNERVGAYNAATETLGAQGFMLPGNLARQRLMLEAAQAFGVDTAGMDSMLPEDILARLSPGQRNAIAQREGAMFSAGMFQMQAGRQRGVRAFDLASSGSASWAMPQDGYGLGAFAGASTGTEAEAERAQRVAQIIIKAEDEISDAVRRGIRIREEVAQLDEEILRRRIRATEQLNRRVTDGDSTVAEILRNDGVEGTGAALRSYRAMRASQQPGAAGMIDQLRGAFGAEQEQVASRLFQARRQGEQQEYVLGALRRGRDPSETQTELRVAEQMAPMRELAEAMRRAGAEGTAEYDRMLQKIREIETSLRAQLAAEKERTAEINSRRFADQTADIGTGADRAAGDRTSYERQRRETRERLALEVRPSLGEGRSPEAARNEAARALLSDTDLRNQVDARYNAMLEAQREAARLDQDRRRRAARVGGTGDPIRDRQAQRDLQIEELAGQYDPVTAQIEGAILRDQWATQDRGAANTPIVAAGRQAQVARARRTGYSEVTGDLSLAAQVVAAESSSWEGRLAAAAVVFNRAREARTSPDRVVSAPGQFEPYGRGSYRQYGPGTRGYEEAMRALQGLQSGEYGDPTGGAQYFYSPREMERRVAAGATRWENHPWMLNPDGTRRQGPVIGGNMFLSAPAGAATAAERRLWAGDGTRAAAAAEYAIANPNGDVGRFMSARVEADAETSLGRLAETADRLEVSFGDLQRSGLTPFQRGLAEALDSVRPMLTEARRLAALLPEGPQRAALLRGANEVEQGVRRNYVGSLEDRRIQENRNVDDEEEDLRFQSGYFFSTTRMQRDLAVMRRQRQLRRSNPYLSEEEVNRDAQRYGDLGELREQARVVGMVRDSWYQVGNAAGQALERVIMQGGKARDVIKALLAEMASYYIRAGSRLAMEGAGSALSQGLGFVGSLFGAGGGLKGAEGAAGLVSAANPLVAAQGAVLSGRAWARPLAQGGGGIFSHAQYVPMADGGTALVGEAGPEAAVPLVRMPSGNLGIRADGGGGPAINNNFNVTVNGGGGGPKEGQRMGADISRALEGMVSSVLVRQLAPGGMLSQANGQPGMR
jgi:hypothetical protein